MKSLKFLGLCLFVSWLIVACSNEGQVDEQPEKDEQDIEENKQDHQEEEIVEKEERSNEGEEEDGNEEEETVEEEEVKEPQYMLNDVGYFKPIDDANPKVVLLTIDDAPDEHALEMAKTLKEYDAPAIFFVNGHFMDTDEEKEIVKEIHDMGFHIGNHTDTHQNLTEISEEKQREEILSLNELIEDVTGEKPKFFRAPHGANTDFSKELVKEEGMLLMNWSYGYDFMADYMDKESLEDIMVNAPQLGKGANLLMHDREWTNAALPGILEGLQEKGYDFLAPDLIQIKEE
ncbi:polysaccharide deacetylase family protein [Piscibacillus halophilus]|uniref:polysaccharide deacetylase family protein n=1 Tax=Piscibacillus halophilus TaxID=571933 RepID=UPI00240A8B32|nr:polysaccharide deacetylase family protein [Piscibacillus halophilus]